MFTCKLCEQDKLDQEAYPNAGRTRSRPVYCRACDKRATFRRNVLRRIRAGTLPAYLAQLRAIVAEAETVQARHAAGLHPINWTAGESPPPAAGPPTA